jgi:hypothetical protein
MNGYSTAATILPEKQAPCHEKHQAALEAYIFTLNLKTRRLAQWSENDLRL